MKNTYTFTLFDDQTDTGTIIYTVVAKNIHSAVTRLLNLAVNKLESDIIQINISEV